MEKSQIYRGTGTSYFFKVSDKELRRRYVLANENIQAAHRDAPKAMKDGVILFNTVTGKPYLNDDGEYIPLDNLEMLSRRKKNFHYRNTLILTDIKKEMWDRQQQRKFKKIRAFFLHLDLYLHGIVEWRRG